MIIKFWRASLFLLLLAIPAHPFSQSITLISWNIQDCGQTKSDEEILAIAKIISNADIVAIQEVVAKHPGGAQSIGRLGDALNRMGAKWDYRISDPTDSPSPYKSERYAFLWKTSSVELSGRPFLDSVLAPYCDREPFIGRFKERKSGKPFVLVNFHSRRFDEHPEEEVKHFASYPNRFEPPVIIAGDFNMNEENKVFTSLYALGYQPAVKNQKTTLKRECNNGEYRANAIDNIYIPKRVVLHEGRVVDFLGTCAQLEAARQISDHLPVLAVISF